MCAGFRKLISEIWNSSSQSLLLGVWSIVQHNLWCIQISKETLYSSRVCEMPLSLWKKASSHWNSVILRKNQTPVFAEINRCVLRQFQRNDCLAFSPLRALQGVLCHRNGSSLLKEGSVGELQMDGLCTPEGRQ